MNIKTHPINPVTTGIQRKPFRLILIIGLVSVGSLFALHTSNINNSQVTTPVVSAYTPSTYSLESLQLITTDSGTAVINLDDLLVSVSFNFEVHEDNYGVPGSEFLAVEITQLSINNIISKDGVGFRDFTDYNDHFNINQLIVAHIYKNKLVEAV